MREPDHTRRVVITGLGIISPIGNTVGDVWTSLTEGRSGIGQITHWDPTPYAPYVVAGEVELETWGENDGRETGISVTATVGVATPEPPKKRSRKKAGE